MGQHPLIVFQHPFGYLPPSLLPPSLPFAPTCDGFDSVKPLISQCVNPKSRLSFLSLPRTWCTVAVLPREGGREEGKYGEYMEKRALFHLRFSPPSLPPSLLSLPVPGSHLETNEQARSCMTLRVKITTNY